MSKKYKLHFKNLGKIFLSIVVLSFCPTQSNATDIIKLCDPIYNEGCVKECNSVKIIRGSEYEECKSCRCERDRSYHSSSKRVGGYVHWHVYLDCKINNNRGFNWSMTIPYQGEINSTWNYEPATNYCNNNSNVKLQKEKCKETCIKGFQCDLNKIINSVYEDEAVNILMNKIGKDKMIDIYDPNCISR